MKKILQVGESIFFQTKKVILVNVGSGGSIIVDVDGVIDCIQSAKTETVNGIRLTNGKTYYRRLKMDRSASIVFG